MHFVIGTAGHIDHGKSSLVQALTGTDPDRLPEEKARGVTIDLGFAHLSLKDTSSEKTYELGIIDVPGHADFVNNMVSGISALDLAIFIVAADDGWMPQSEEHLHILNYLGIQNAIIALTKIDLCDDVPFSIEVLRDELIDTPIAEAPIIPVSSVTGEGIDDLRNEILKAIKQCPPPSNVGKPRIAIDRLFSPKGTGTVITGTLCGGNLHVGDSLILQPQGVPTRIRYIQNHRLSLETASPGMRTALNLPDLPIDAPGKPGAQRGNTLTIEGVGKPTDTLDIELKRIARDIPNVKARPLRHTETVILHHGSARCRARIILHDRTTLSPGESSLAQLRLESPIFILTGDKIVIRDGAQQNTLAGGTVLDACATRQGFRTEKRAAFLTPRAEHPDQIATFITTQLQRDHILSPDSPLPNTPFSDSDIHNCIENLIQSQAIIRYNHHLISSRWWKSILKSAESHVKAWHRNHPDLPSMPIEELLKNLSSECPASILQLIPEALEEIGYIRKGKTIAHKNHTLTLPEDMTSEADALLQKLADAGLMTPTRSELAPTPKSEKALQFLIRSGKAIELEPKVIIDKPSFDDASKKIREYLQVHGRATASELRQHLDSTRKVVMPLLELLDERGLTVRTDNYRQLKD